MNTIELCGIKYRAETPECKRPKGHEGGHNGYSDRPPLSDVVKTPLKKKSPPPDPNQLDIFGNPKQEGEK